jgi:hypothetical protein
MRDYLAFLRPDPDDAEHHGIKGMKWGIRRSDAQLANDTKSRAAKGHEVTPTKKAAAATAGLKAATGEETSSARYARLAAQAKAGKASDMSETDLKFFNARTEALAKINKLNETNPSWLSTTSKKVLQQAAQNTMQSVADGVAKKYISGPILESLPDPTKK